MSIASCFLNPVECAKQAFGDTVAATVPSAWSAICKSFAQAAAQLLSAFAKAFTALPDVNPTTAGISSVYGMCVVLAATVAALLMLGQVIRTAWTHDGTGLAHGAAGIAKAALAWPMTAAVATAALAASDQATQWIVQGTFGSQQALAVRLGNIVNWSKVAGDPGQAGVGASLLLVIAVIGIVLVLVLWFELLLRNAAIAVLIAVSPISAAGQVSETTKVWWQRTVSAVVQLVILKPVIALVFAVGFAMSGSSTSIESLLEGLLVLVLAVLCWPVIARFFTFATIQSANSGLATALGFAAGRLSGGGTVGVHPSQWSRGAENRTMAGHADVTGGDSAADEAGAADRSATPGRLANSRAATGSTGAGGASGVRPSGSAGGSSGGTGSAVLAGIGFALGMANRAGTVLAGRMEQTAGHAGMHGAYPYSTVGGERTAPPRPRRASQPGDGPGASNGEQPSAGQDVPDSGHPSGQVLPDQGAPNGGQPVSDDSVPIWDQRASDWADSARPDVPPARPPANPEPAAPQEHGAADPGAEEPGKEDRS